MTVLKEKGRFTTRRSDAHEQGPWGGGRRKGLRPVVRLRCRRALYSSACWPAVVVARDSGSSTSSSASWRQRDDVSLNDANGVSQCQLVGSDATKRGKTAAGADQQSRALQRQPFPAPAFLLPNDSGSCLLPLIFSFSSTRLGFSSPARTRFSSPPTHLSSTHEIFTDPTDIHHHHQGLFGRRDARADDATGPGHGLNAFRVCYCNMHREKNKEVSVPFLHLLTPLILVFWTLSPSHPPTHIMVICQSTTPTPFDAIDRSVVATSFVNRGCDDVSRTKRGIELDPSQSQGPLSPLSMPYR